MFLLVRVWAVKAVEQKTEAMGTLHTHKRSQAIYAVEEVFLFLLPDRLLPEVVQNRGGVGFSTCHVPINLSIKKFVTVPWILNNQ